MVIWHVLYFHPYLGKIPILTNIFQGCWTHQLDEFFAVISGWWFPKLWWLSHALLPRPGLMWAPVPHKRCACWCEWSHMEVTWPWHDPFPLCLQICLLYHISFRKFRSLWNRKLFLQPLFHLLKGSDFGKCSTKWLRNAATAAANVY